MTARHLRLVETGADESLTVALSPGTLDAIAERAAEIVLTRMALDQDGGPRWLTLTQAAERLGCSPDAVRMRCNRGRLEARHQGRRRYVSAVSVDQLGEAA